MSETKPRRVEKEYQEAASIQLLLSPVLALPSTSSTVTLLLFMLARLAVVARTCTLSAQSATCRHQYLQDAAEANDADSLSYTQR